MGLYLTIVLISISLIINDVEHFSCASWPSVCLFRRNVYLGFLPIFWLDFLFILYWILWAACNFWRLIPCQFNYLQVFFPILWVLFVFLLPLLGGLCPLPYRFQLPRMQIWRVELLLLSYNYGTVSISYRRLSGRVEKSRVLMIQWTCYAIPILQCTFVYSSENNSLSWLATFYGSLFSQLNFVIKFIFGFPWWLRWLRDSELRFYWSRISIP